jgi:hypothetical protein
MLIKGQLLNEIISPVSLLTGSIITSMCTDQDGNYLYTGDSLGYITVWWLNDFVEKVNASKKKEFLIDPKLIGMVVCWKAHVNRIVQLNYMTTNKILVSASIDESVR